MNSICYEQVYYVECTDGARANPIAIRPEISDTDIAWLDTSRGMVIKLGTILNRATFGSTPPDVIEIEAEDGAHYKLVKLTLEIYNNKVKHRVMLPPQFSSDEEVQNFYLTTDFENY